MTCADWVALLRRTTEDRDFVSLLKAHGFRKIPRSGSVNLGACDEVDGMTLNFCHPIVLREKIKTTKKTTLVFHGIAAHLRPRSAKDPHYTGPLPYRLEASDSVEKLTEKLGKPRSQNRKEGTFTWRIERLEVIAYFSTDSKAFTSLAIFLLD